MNLLDILSIESRVTQAKKESPQERYARIVIDLGAAENVGKDIHIPITGDYLAKIKYTGSATGTYFKFGNKRSSIIYAAEFRKRHTPFIEFDGIWLTNPSAQTGKELILFVGGAFAGEIEPSTGIKTGITDVDGVDITPAQDKRQISHTVHQIDRRELNTIDVGEAIATSATKVKWAIIYVDTADAMIGDSTVTQKVGGHPGLLVGKNAYASIEYLDLNTLYIVNEDGAVKPYFSAIYIEEA